jgi:DNA mismatch repair protein MutS
MQNLNNFSLLYPGETREDGMQLTEQVIKDLELEYLIDFIIPGRLLKKLQGECMRKVFLNPCTDAGVITYRQDITEDLLECEALREAFENLAPVIETLSYYRSGRFSQDSPFYALVFRIGELESFLICIDTLKKAFEKSKDSHGIRSVGMKQLYDLILNLYENKDFMHMKKNLPEIASQLRNIRSISIGLNLDNDFKPVAASLISLNTEVYSGNTDGLFSKLLRKNSEGIDGLAPLHTKDNPFMRSLFQDLALLMKKVCEPIQKGINRYININTSLFINLRDEMIFYSNAVNFLLKVRAAGLPVCKPEVLPADTREMNIKDTFNLNLFIRMYRNNAFPDAQLVVNDVNLDEKGRIMILTGPNQGGKTVFTQGVGLTHILFQAGLFIPGSRGRISPVDNIFTHFQLEEQIVKAVGRFAEEAKRMQECLSKASSHSLILMNESFASTNYNESLYIVRDIMRIFRMLGPRIIFATHFHELASQVDRINAEVPGKGKLFSMVSMVTTSETRENGVKRTYKLVPRPPMGKSYARDMAYQYGICFEQLQAMLLGRGVLSQQILVN